MDWIGSSEIGRPGRHGVWTRFRFNPGVIVWPLCGLAIFYALARAIETYPVAKHRDSYRQATFVVRTIAQDEWAEGVIEPGGREHRHLLERTLKHGWVLAESTVLAIPGRELRVWWSDAEGAPVVPVSKMPCLPRREMTPFWIVFAVGLFFAALRFTYRAQEHAVEKRTEVLFDEPR
jgi:hypothetical protein